MRARASQLHALLSRALLLPDSDQFTVEHLDSNPPSWGAHASSQAMPGPRHRTASIPAAAAAGDDGAGDGKSGNCEQGDAGKPVRGGVIYYLEKGDSVFVATHTSAGKTVVAEHASVFVALKYFMLQCGRFSVPTLLGKNSRLHAIFVHQVRQFVQYELHIAIRSTFICPLAIGPFQLETVFHRDVLFAGNRYNTDGVRIRFISHDQGINRRDQDYTRYVWIMILGFPLYYRSDEYIDQVVTTFGKMLQWHNNTRAPAG